MNSNNQNSHNAQSPHDVFNDIKNAVTSFAKASAQIALPKLIEINQTSIESFMEAQSHDIDKFILSTQRNENLNYVAGHAFLKVLESSNPLQMKVFFDLYFQNPQEQWVNKKNETEAFRMDDYLTKEAYEQLATAKELKFDIEKPKG